MPEGSSSAPDAYSAALRRWQVARYAVPFLAFVLAVVAVSAARSWSAPMVVFVIFLPFPVEMLVRALWERWKVRRSLQWPSAEAVVQASGARYLLMSKSTWVDIVYRYEVGGRTFRGEYGAHWYRNPDDFLAKYPQGRRVLVRCNPGDPSVAILDGAEGAARTMLFQSLALIVLGFALAWSVT